MESASTVRWKPGQRTLFWARTSCYSICAGAWIGAGLFFVSEPLAAVALIVFLPIAFLGIFRFWLVVGYDEGIPRTVRNKLKKDLLFYGPVVVLQVLLYNRFPNSSFSGLSKTDYL